MTTCIEKPLVDAHFEGTISPAGETRLRAHLPTCASCTEYYERRVLLARLDPGALSVEERLARGLGLPARGAGAPNERDEDLGASGRRAPLGKLGLLGLVAAAALLLLWFASRKPHGDEFAARGGPPRTAPYVRVYRATKGGVPEPLVGPMRRDDELAFAYESVAGKERLMVLGLDEHGHVYWFHPAWTDESADPEAVPAATSPELHPLREAISHDFDGRTLEIHALFSSTTSTARTVRSVERLLAGKKAPLGPLELPETIDVVAPVEIAP